MKRVLIVPGAGAGRRLGTALPKLLVPVHGRPMIDWILALYQDWVERICLVVAPSALDAVRTHCAGRGERITYDVQASPTGMLDAALVPSGRIRVLQPEAVWITWADQIAVSPDTVRTLAGFEEAGSDWPLVVPTLRVRQPYIHLARNEAHQITAVLQRRENDAMPAFGETDIGLFGLSRRCYLELLPIYAGRAQRSRVTGERNLLPFISWVAAREAVATFCATDSIEALGINTPADLQLVEAWLERRAGTPGRR